MLTETLLSEEISRGAEEAPMEVRQWKFVKRC